MLIIMNKKNEINHIQHICEENQTPNTIRLIHDDNDSDAPEASTIHWWSLFDGEFDHEIIGCPYCLVRLE